MRLAVRASLLVAQAAHQDRLHDALGLDALGQFVQRALVHAGARLVLARPPCRSSSKRAGQAGVGHSASSAGARSLTLGPSNASRPMPRPLGFLVTIQVFSFFSLHPVDASSAHALGPVAQARVGVDVAAVAVVDKLRAPGAGRIAAHARSCNTGRRGCPAACWRNGRRCSTTGDQLLSAARSSSRSGSPGATSSAP